MKPKTSKYKGVYYSSPNSRWVVQLERYDHYPCFMLERDAAIYAEYHYRLLYDESPNFPELSDDELADEYESTLSRRDVEQAEMRSHSKQGVKKRKSTTSKYTGIFLNRNENRWIAKIQYRGKPTYIASFSIHKYADAEILAAKAYDQKALELYGDKARLNFPLGD